MAEPNHLRAHYCTGLLLEYTGENEQALEHFQIVVKADPKDAFAAYYLGKCWGTAGQLEQAIQSYKKSIELDQYLRSPYNACALLLRRVNRVEEADRMLAEFMRLERNPRARLVKTVYTRMGPKAEAVAVDLPAAKNGRRVRVAGMVITRQRPGTAKGFVFLTLEDETGISNVIIRPDLFDQNRMAVVRQPFLIVDGVLQHQDGVLSVRAERVEGMSGGASVDSHDFY